MSEYLTDDQIALLCEIEESDLARLSRDGKKRDLETLISRGYAETTQSPPGSGLKLTAKGIEFLGKRGVGLNEA